jgi:hypothetical protein
MKSWEVEYIGCDITGDCTGVGESKRSPFGLGDLLMSTLLARFLSFARKRVLFGG